MRTGVLKTVLGTMSAVALAAASTVLCSQPAAALDVTEYVTPSDADSYTDTGNNSTNYGTSNDLKVESAATGALSTKRTVMRFDLTSFEAGLPLGATITDVALKLWMDSITKSSGADTTRTYDLYECDNNSWVETTITLTGPNIYQCASSLSGATLLANSTTPTTGSAAQAMNWTSADLTNQIITTVGAVDKRISLLVKDSADSVGGNPATVPHYVGTFHSKEGAANTYPADSTDFKPVLAITYHVDDTPPVCEYPLQIVDFTATPGNIVLDQSSSFDIMMTIHACQDLDSVKGQGGTAGNTTTSEVDCDKGTCEPQKPGKSKKAASGNVIIPWLIDEGMHAGDDATLQFTVTTGDNPADNAICLDDPFTSILKNVTGAWSFTTTYNGVEHYTTTHGPLVVDIYCGDGS